jgi:hypothetical protein
MVIYFGCISGQNTGIMHIFGAYFIEYPGGFFLKKKLTKHYQLNVVK